MECSGTCYVAIGLGQHPRLKWDMPTDKYPWRYGLKSRVLCIHEPPEIPEVPHFYCWRTQIWGTVNTVGLKVTSVKCTLYIHSPPWGSASIYPQILLYRTEKSYPFSHLSQEYTITLVEMADFPEGLGYESKNLIDTSGTIAQSSGLSVNTIGEPRKKARFDFLNVLALLISFLFLALACAIVELRLPISWYLGFQQQLTIIGLLLTLQSLCLKRLSTKTFLLIEANFTSRLQNYDAILSNSVFAD